MYVAEVHHEGDSFFIDEPAPITSFHIVFKPRWEKNWVPFVYKDELLLGYSLSPHIILKPILGTNLCETMADTSNQATWDWGELRGGTPALLEGDRYLAFFHSSKLMSTIHSKGKNLKHYFMGAYTFSSEPPFNITHISPEPIVGKKFYRGPAYKTWKPLRVVFPGGFVTDDEFIWVAYGRQDFEVWIVKLDKKRLLDSLVPVSP
jgi:predicted GH43/DUF377 family glycosyl hydrolase